MCVRCQMPSLFRPFLYIRASVLVSVRIEGTAMLGAGFWGKTEKKTRHPCFWLRRGRDAQPHPCYFPRPKPRRRAAVKKLSGEACQTRGGSCNPTGVRVERPVVGEENQRERVTLCSQHCRYTESNRWGGELFRALKASNCQSGWRQPKRETALF